MVHILTKNGKPTGRFIARVRRCSGDKGSQRA
jgi:hypothetical protein